LIYRIRLTFSTSVHQKSFTGQGRRQRGAEGIDFVPRDFAGERMPNLRPAPVAISG
jgi:hypothetical protein